MFNIRRVLMSVISVLLFVAFTICTLYMFTLVSELNDKARLSTHALDNNNITFTLPRRWEVVNNGNNHLFVVNPEASMKMQIYKKSELELVHASDLLNKKAAEALAEVDTYRLVRNFGASRMQDRIIHSRLYLVEKNGMQTQYYITVMEFIGSETYVFLLYEAREAVMRYHLNNINRMLRRMEWQGEEIDLAMF